MYFHFYLRKGMIYIPTVGKMDKGFYRDIEPVAVVSASDTETFQHALAATVTRGNPDVPMLRRREWPPAVVLKYAAVRSWSAFERGMSLWGLEAKDGTWQIVGKKKKADGATVDDPEQTITFPPGASIEDVISRMISILQHAGRQ